jgi:methyl-accepting chemotaxis protein
MNDTLEQEMMEREFIVVGYMAENLADPLLQKDTIEIDEIIDNTMMRSTDIRYIYVVDFDGVVIAHTFSQGFPADMLTANPMLPNEDTAARVFSVEGESIQDVGVRVLDGMDAKVYFGFSKTHLISSTNKTTSTIISTAAIVLLFGIAISFILTRSITGPIEKLVVGTKRVAEGDLDFQVEVTTSDDIGILADSFNRMVAERKTVEANLKLFKNLINQSNDAIFIIDPKTYQILEVNEKGCTNLGYERKEIIGMKIFNICVTMPDEVSCSRKMSSSFSLVPGIA